MKSRVCTILCLLTLLGFATVFVQEQWKPFKMKPLNGFTTTTDKPKLTFAHLASGEYQDDMEHYISENFGFREFFIRVYNQFSYSCFRQITNDNVVEGANRELFLKMYLEEVTGKRLLSYFPDIEAAKADARANVEATLRLIDTLHQHGTDFLFVFAPSKTAIYPEWMPKEFQRQVSEFSLEEYYIELFEENGIPYINFLSYFKDIKDSFPYPLYTRTGTHWAESTIPMVADSIFRKLESVTGYRLPSIDYLDDNITSDYSIQDGELEASMNLLFPLKKPALPWPVFALADTIGKDHPNLLVIGDSYFIQLRNSCFVDAFRNWDYWKYNRDIASSRKAYNGKAVRYLAEAPTVLEEADIVLGIFTAPCIYNFMYGFPKSALELYEKGNVTEEEVIQMTIQRIKDNPKWMQAIERQAKERGLTIEDNLRKNAIYVINEEKKKNENP